MLRKPAVSGSFYNNAPHALRAELSDYLNGASHDRNACGLIVPHAGYVFSARIAAEAYKAARIPSTVVILGPNHHGLGAQAAVFASGEWQTPLGQVPIAQDLATLMLEHCSLLSSDEIAHRFEHAIEVQVPFLQCLREDLRILPVSLGQASLEEWLQLGREMGEILKEYPEPVLLVASSDMNHFAPVRHTLKVDALAIEYMEKYDPAGLYRTVREHQISMCGVTPVTVMLEAARALGATRCELLKYGHSGEVNGDEESVVGYAALCVE